MINYNQLLEKFTLPLAIILSISLLIGAYFFIKRFDKPNLTTTDEQKITVDVAGAVNQPGVYELASGQIIEDAITMAGGIADMADLTLTAKIINRAALVQDHGKIYIPIKGDTPASISAETATNTSLVGSSGLISIININTASATELDRLSGIGPIIAGRIIDYRQKYGAFKRKEDIVKVSGIGSAMYAKIKDQITI
ncbi:helix-hairpin-helix domain-containing protein [Patescibacteria group bacterium]|nr:helix-hairpin-helix domain-containing protein [Patescibacteria group bacterium]